jgi:hypothetical protein
MVSFTEPTFAVRLCLFQSSDHAVTTLVKVPVVVVDPEK